MEATEINTKLLERLSDYVDDEYTGDVLVISVFENIRFAEDRTELEKVLGPKAKKKIYFNRYRLIISVNQKMKCIKINIVLCLIREKSLI